MCEYVDKFTPFIDELLSVSKPYNLQNEKFLISDIFKKGVFNNFNRYCTKKGLVYMGDLKYMNFSELIGVSGFGEERLRLVIDKYNECMYSEYTPSLRIDDFYPENKFNMFRAYCLDNNIVTIKDLQLIDFDKIACIEGIGVGKLSQIKDKYLSLVEKNNLNLENGINIANRIDTLYVIHDDYKNIEIKFAFDDIIVDKLKKNGILNIDDLANISEISLKKTLTITEKKLEKIHSKTKLFSLPLSDFIAKSFETIKNEKKYAIYSEVVYKKKTLEQVGKELGVTRERIRQQKSKIERMALPILRLFEEIVSKNGLLDDKLSFGFDELEALIGSYENAIFAKDIIINCDMEHISYLKALDIFLYNENLDYVNKALIETICELDDVFIFIDEMLHIEQMLIEKNISFVDVFSMPDYLCLNGYNKYNDYFIKGRLSREFLSEAVLKKYFLDGIDNTSNDIKKLQDFINLEFGIELPMGENLRNWWALFERKGSKAVLWGKSRKIHIDNVRISDSILQSIKDIISSELNNTPALVSADYLFNKIEGVLVNSRSNIQNKESLYGVIQYYFADIFSFKKLSIKPLEHSANTQEILEHYLLENNGIVKLSDIKIKFKWTEAMLNAAINFNKNILLWDNGKELIHASKLILNVDFIEIFNEKTQISFIDGYTNGYMIANKSRILLLKNNLKDDAVSVYSLAKHLFSDKYFFSRRPHVLLNSVDSQFTVSDLILNMFNKKPMISYGEAKHKLVTDYGFNDMMAGNHLAKIMNELFQIDIDKYCLPIIVQYSNKDVENISNQACDLLKEKNYIILSEFEKTDLSNCTLLINGELLQWNQYIVKSLLLQHFKSSYRLLLRKGYDLRYDNIIVVPIDSEILTYIDALIYIIDEEFIDKEHFVLPNIEKFLIDKELISHKIPIEFFNSEKVTMDELGRIFIKR